MKAYTKSSQVNSDISLTQVEVPGIEDSEMLIEVRAIGVGVHDEYFHPEDVEYPYVIGIEGSGIIEKIGKNITSYKKGERIAFINSLNKKGGTWAEYTALPDSSLIIRIPESMSFEEAASIPVVGNTILKAFSSLNLKRGDDIFIAGGSGAIGTLAIQIASHKGYKVFASSSKKNHDYMKSLGAEVTVDYHDNDWQEQIKEIIPNGVDAAIAIQPGTAEESSRVVKEKGTVVAVSGDQVQLEREIILQQIPHMKNVTKELEELFNMVIDGRIKLTLNKYTFTEGKEVLEKVKTRHGRGKSILSMQN